MKTFEIWVEGYRVTGNSAQASRVGSGQGETFAEAVEYYKSKNPGHGIEGMSIWGCSLYDNEADARRSFG